MFRATIVAGAKFYISSLLSRVPRKNIERFAEEFDGIDSQNLQQFISDSPCKCGEGNRDDGVGDTARGGTRNSDEVGNNGIYTFVDAGGARIRVMLRRNERFPIPLNFCICRNDGSGRGRHRGLRLHQVTRPRLQN